MKVETVEIDPGFSISRIIKGGWQLSKGHGDRLQNDPVKEMFAFADKGINTFDCADIYTGVEELIGNFLTSRKAKFGSSDDIRVLTKFVPDYDDLATLSKKDVEKIIDRSLLRLKKERLDMVQFSWWTYSIPRWVETAHWLKELQLSGKIHLLSGTNFNTAGVQAIVEGGVSLSTLQVQYSLLDARPENGLTEFCSKHKIQLLCYGTVAGGFISEEWLGALEPKPPFSNRSLVKYKLIIEEFGGWALFQELLKVLQSIAIKHQVSIANVSTRYILDRPSVAAAIVGARTSDHLNENLNVFKLKLDEHDDQAISNILAQRKGPTGDVFDLERIKDGPHGSIMKYNLNRDERG